MDSARNFDLEERTYQFALRVRRFLKKLPRTVCNEIDGRQLIRSSGSVGANYVEANDHVGDRDFLYRIRICRKEAKESRYWLRLLIIDDPDSLHERQTLATEAEELMRIFAAIHRTCLAKYRTASQPRKLTTQS